MSHLAFFITHANVFHHGGQPVLIELSIANISEDGKDPKVIFLAVDHSNLLTTTKDSRANHYINKLLTLKSHLPESVPLEHLSFCVRETDCETETLASGVKQRSEEDKELVQSAIDYASAEIKNKRLDSETKLEFERIKLAQLQKQLELANIQKNLPQNFDIRNQSVLETAANINVETLLKSVKTLTIPVPSRVESYNLFFQSLEKAFKIKEVPEQFKGEIPLNILGERVNNLLVHVSEEELNNYMGSTDFREEQCRSFNGKTFGFPGVDANVKWVPHYTGDIHPR
ncbi:uncharacterized protein TNCV_2943621 [Trichonephila clavipes]|nr:uncharacterized protein TNCV_2943621 [Trichonephila clavipes]